LQINKSITFTLGTSDLSYSGGLPTGREDSFNTVYKLWLGQSALGKSCGFSKASFYLERFVQSHATTHMCAESNDRLKVVT
ncbi:hypothetical protein MWU76_21710, partial [Gelidibacter sp. F2691]|nr:hypothetical protein [Gelidibacter sp. F2691]